MFRKVLIANRGAIACRIIRTLRPHGHRQRRGVFRRRPLTRCMSRRPTRRCGIGPAPAAESYLNADAILEAARADRRARRSIPATAFCRENADFAEACEAAGIVFIGPTPEQMRAFGLKHTAREHRAAGTACRCCRAPACWRRDARAAAKPRASAIR